MNATTWIIGISVGVIALAFVALVIYLIITLVSLRKNLETMHEICEGLEDKIHAFDPLLRTVVEVGELIEKKANYAIHHAEEVIHEKKCQTHRVVNTSMEVAEWALLGLSLWQKIKDRR